MKLLRVYPLKAAFYGLFCGLVRYNIPQRDIFIFSGNLAKIPAVDSLLRSLLEKRAYLTSLLASQVISNVPAALLLSGFTDQAKQILLGVNVGGLGTPIASLASLISLKLYGHSRDADQKRYLLYFTLINVLLLILLSLFCMFL